MPAFAGMTIPIELLPTSFALRLGLRQIDGLREADVQRLVSIRDGIATELNPHLFAPPPPILSSPGLGTGDASNHRSVG